MDIIYEDNHLLVVNKPCGQLVQGDQTGRSTLLDEGKAWLKARYGKPGLVFLALVHRLDRPASGVVILARTSKAASRLSEQIRSRATGKTYWARVSGELPESGTWTDHLLRETYDSRIVAATEGKEATLSFTRTALDSGISTAEIDLETGRHHQIRVQFAHRGHPILGDRRYGSDVDYAPDAIALHAREMVIQHPTRNEEMRFTAEPDRHWQSAGLDS